VVDSSGLENRHSFSNYRGFESLSLQLQLFIVIKYLFLLKNGFLFLFFFFHKNIERKARLDGIAEPEPKKSNR
jgi:hypothetical protein